MNDETETPPTGEPAGAGDPGGPDPRAPDPRAPVGGEPTTGPTPPPVEDTSPKPLAVEEPVTDEYSAAGAAPQVGGPEGGGPQVGGPQVGGSEGAGSDGGPGAGGWPAPGWASPPPPEAPASAPAAGRGAGWTVPPASGAHPVGGDRHGPGGPRGPWQFLLGALIGAVVAALVAGGIVAATRDDSSNPSPSAPLARNTSVFAEPKDVQGVLQKVEPAVVVVRTGGATDAFAMGESQGGEGTGFVISSDGYVVTNNHVIEGAGGRIVVTFLDGTDKPAKVVGRSPGNDLAVLKVDAHNLPTAELGDSNSLQVGDQVLAIGNALALEGGPSVTQGIVSAKGRQITTENGETLFNLLQTDAAINRGNSGGPLVNSRGQVVGINTAIAPPDQAQNVGFAIPISQARPIIDELRQGRNVRTAFLGVETQTFTRAIANELGIRFTPGAVVRRVSDGSPARSAGIKARDVIVKVGEVKVETADDVAAGVRTRRPGDKVSVEVARDGKRLTLTATLAERPEQG